MHIEYKWENYKKSVMHNLFQKVKAVKTLFFAIFLNKGGDTRKSIFFVNTNLGTFLNVQ